MILKELDGERQLPVIVGAFEAQAIALAIEGIEMPRPMTHDLLSNLLMTISLTSTSIVSNKLLRRSSSINWSKELFMQKSLSTLTILAKKKLIHVPVTQ